jgi:hypothetical protein
MKRAIAVAVIGCLTMSCQLSQKSRERSEALLLCGILESKRKAFTEVSSEESAALQRVNAWVNQGIAFVTPDRRPAWANDARNFSAIIQNARDRLSPLRSTIRDAKLSEALVQTVRSGIVEDLDKREAHLASVQGLLQDTAAQLPSTAWGRVPASIEQLRAKLSTYQPPEDLFAQNVTKLRTQFQITDADLEAAKGAQSRK